jgi:hypothetical protein
LENHDILKRVAKFLLDIFAATLIFLCIAGLAVGLNLGIHYLESIGVSTYITDGLTFVEVIIFAVDIGLFLIYLTRSSIDLARAIWNH